MLPVVDIFAGPGGLGEGFAQAGFKVLISAEMDQVACSTLTLRKFFHCFPKGKVPDLYYRFLRGEIAVETLKEEYPSEWMAASNSVANVELGTEKGNQILYRKLDEALAGNNGFILIGGPPCQAYSLAGRSRMLGPGLATNSLSTAEITSLRAELAGQFYADHRHTLYLEYLKILCRYQPAVFVLENVKGMSSAKVSADAQPGSVFGNICHGLQNPFDATGVLSSDGKTPSGYELYALNANEDGLDSSKETISAQDCLLKSENYGVPQNRHRIIIIGVRSDLAFKPAPLKRAEFKHTVRDAIGDMPRLRSGLSKDEDTNSNWVEAVCCQAKKHLIGSTSIDDFLQKQINIIRGENEALDRGAVFIGKQQILEGSESNKLLQELSDPRIGGFVQHQTRSHMSSDLVRYFLVSALGSLFNKSPTLSEWQGQLDALKPNHKNVSTDVASLKTSTHKDRFRVQVWDRPSSTVVSHISKDGHYFIHPDPSQCRSLTVREAARLQTFPDNYFFCGNRTQQYHQVGNAVPVFLAKQIAMNLLQCLEK